MRSKELNRLYDIRKKLDNKTNYKDYHVKDKQNDNTIKKSNTKTSYDYTIASKQIKILFRYGLVIDPKTKIKIYVNDNDIYNYVNVKIFKFVDEFQLASVLTEYSKKTKILNFIVNDNKSIIWKNRYDNKIMEVRVFKGDIL